jgi:hypothetical protein
VPVSSPRLKILSFIRNWSWNILLCKFSIYLIFTYLNQIPKQQFHDHCLRHKSRLSHPVFSIALYSLIKWQNTFLVFYSLLDSIPFTEGAICSNSSSAQIIIIFMNFRCIQVLEKRYIWNMALWWFIFKSQRQKCWFPDY